jgi:putative addiction module component (TIGR02574 family)
MCFFAGPVMIQAYSRQAANGAADLHPCIARAVALLRWGMTDRARKLLRDAMELPPAERAQVAAGLLASLDGQREAHVEAAWAGEIERRARETIADPNDDLAWETVRDALYATPMR